ncbi:MAG: T9SS type A sorting domain-containing protein [Bacteroidota bacterium]
MRKLILTIFIIKFVFVQHCVAAIWQVGPLHTHTMPSQVSALVSNGDTVEIDAGIYNSDVAQWTANNLLLKGVGGLAHLKANGNGWGGKAIWVISGNSTRVENIEFSLCSVPDHNGAGIRQEGRNLTVRYCYFHNNEDGILAGTINPSNILIEYTEFGFNGYGDGFSHNLYINNIDTLTFRYNYSHHCSVGHELKSRAHVNFIYYNRISDESAGTASRSIDLPNGGIAYLIGNVIEQGPQSQNSNIIGYGLEGLTNPAPHQVYAINNTIVNNYPGGSFFQFNSQTALFKGYNNILAGSGNFVSGSFPSTVDTASNRVSSTISSFAFVNVSLYDYHLTGNSTSTINYGTNPGVVNTVSLNPVIEYEHPHSAIARCINGNLDIGAYEYCPSLCAAPSSGFFTSDITSTTAKVNWNIVSGAVTYQVRYRATGTSTWIKKNTTGNVGNKILTGLLSSTMYVWQVRTKCSLTPVTWSAWTAKRYFTTTALRSADTQFADLSEVNVYPNPAHDKITVSIDVKQQVDIILQLTDITGRMVLSENQSSREGLNSWQLGLNHLSKGIYMLDVKTRSGSWKTKVVVE